MTPHSGIFFSLQDMTWRKHKVPKIKKMLPYEMKFLVPNCSCLQNPWLGGYHPQIPVLSALCPQLNLFNPPPRKNPGYATGDSLIETRVRMKTRGLKLKRGVYLQRGLIIKRRKKRATCTYEPTWVFQPVDYLLNNCATPASGDRRRIFCGRLNMYVWPAVHLPYTYVGRGQA